MAPRKSARGVIITEGRTLDTTVPADLVKLFNGRPRILMKRLEWFGIHPLPAAVLSPELRKLQDRFEIIAVPKSMV